MAVQVREVTPATGARPKAVTTSVIIPAYNEEEGLPIVLSKLLSVIDETHEVIVVDDGSTDRTAQIASGFPCRLVIHESNRGKGEAIKSGIRAALGHKLVIIDADDTYPVEAIPDIAAGLDSVDMVVASRVDTAGHVPVFNRFGNFIFRQLIRHLYGFRPSDPLTGLYAIRKVHAIRMRPKAGGFGIETEMAIKGARMGLRMLDMPVEYRPRLGETKLHPLRDGYRIFQTILKLIFLYNPGISFILPGIMLFAIGVALMAALTLVPMAVAGTHLGSNTFLLAAMASLGGFNLGTLGFGLNLYAVAYKFSEPDVVTRLFMSRNMAAKMVLVAMTFLIVGVVLATVLGIGWIGEGFGAFQETEALILAAFLGVLGIQMGLSTAFLSIFQDELRHDGQDESEVVICGETLPRHVYARAEYEGTAVGGD